MRDRKRQQIEHQLEHKCCHQEHHDTVDLLDIKWSVALLGSDEDIAQPYEGKVGDKGQECGQDRKELGENGAALDIGRQQRDCRPPSFVLVSMLL